MNNIVLFASGSGSNAEKIIQYFQSSDHSRVVAVFSNNPHAKVLERAQKLGVNTLVFNKQEFSDGTILSNLRALNPHLIVLAGFLWKFPESLVREFEGKIINIHPALLPKYGGKGMYGMHVHQAVLENQEVETGITIHYVNEQYDEGAIIFQKAVIISDCKYPEEIAAKVHALEHEYFPKVIDKLLTS